MNKIWKFADIAVNANFTYPYLDRRCRLYECDEHPALSIVISEDDIQFEREKDKDGTVYSPGYCESLAFYRKFAMMTLDENVLLMHGSAIRFHGNGYIYTAPSGTGKSTHTGLCKKIYGDEVSYINDDKPLLRLIDGTWYVYGTPWDGKHHLSTNICAPLGGICKLERGKINSIRRIEYDDVLRILMTQIYRPDDEENLRKTLNLAISLAKIPSWELKCNISGEAAQLSLRTMEIGYENKKGIDFV